MKKVFLLAVALLLACSGADAQTPPKASSLKPMCDSLAARMEELTGVKSSLSVQKLIRRGKRLDIQFRGSLSDYPWHIAEQEYFRQELENLWPEYVKGFIPGDFSTKDNRFQDYLIPIIGDDGQAPSYRHSMPDPRTPGHRRFINRVGEREFQRGMSDRYIALWQSHGRYWNDKQCQWSWQRCALHRTIEDIFTQSFVLPFLIPMLENAGAYVMTPRERDTQWREHVVDNNCAFASERGERMRKEGVYEETGVWNDAGIGFADALQQYSISDNPFTMGTCRSTLCSGSEASASVKWTPVIEQGGRYAVYISYASFPESTTAAHYTVHHRAGKSEFYVNQTMGGSTWIYLGTFEFAAGTDACVVLDNRGKNGKIVSADAVRFGGGMGKVERGGSISGLPSYDEGALYSMVWAGADSTVTRNWDSEYTNEFASRGPWTQMMKERKGIPFDLSFAMHSDAGITPNDSTIGTLAIYTYLWDGKRKFDDGRSRMVSRLLAEYVQDQVVNDIRSDFEPQWRRREIRDRSYSESRTTSVPGMILELLSHQNFADMKHGLDPAFRFTASRAVYKGMLKALSAFYHCPYTVQPLPVHGMSLSISESGNARLSWKATLDEKEPTAAPSSYIIYRRIDDGCFDEGVEISGTSIEIPVEEGHIHSFKVCAMNEGGISFPSEILSIGKAPNSKGEVLIVNNFDRISAPAWIDSPEYGGFEGRIDSGVPYISDLSYCGENYEFRRTEEYIDDENPGFGASRTDYAGEIVAGNTFDYPYMHGKALMQLGYSFCSVSREAFCESYDYQARILDLICGKQRSTLIGSGAVPVRYAVFPEELKGALRQWCADGRDVIISGSDIASDEKGSGFTETLFGFGHASSKASRDGKIEGMEFYNCPNPDFYCVESPDGLVPASRKAKVILKYPSTGLAAAVVYKTRTYKTVSIGVPIETVKAESDRVRLLKMSLQALRAN